MKINVAEKYIRDKNYKLDVVILNTFDTFKRYLLDETIFSNSDVCC